MFAGRRAWRFISGLVKLYLGIGVVLGVVGYAADTLSDSCSKAIASWNLSHPGGPGKPGNAAVFVLTQAVMWVPNLVNLVQAGNQTMFHDLVFPDCPPGSPELKFE